MIVAQKISKHWSGLEEFEKFIWIATVCHLCLLFLAIVFEMVSGFSFWRKDDQVKMLESSVRVDVVAMPKYTVQELKQMKVLPSEAQEKAEVKKAEETQEKEIAKEDFKVESKKKVDLSSLLKNLSNTKVERKGVREKKGEGNNLNTENLKKLILEGNKISKGTSVVGNEYSEEMGEFQRYVEMIPGLVRPYWKLPSYLREKALTCRVRIFISSSGTIVKSSIYETSGVPEYDSMALVAINRLSSLPAPDAKIIGRLAGGEVILGFPL